MKMYIYNNKTNKQSVVAEPPLVPRKEREAKNRSEKQQS